MKVLFLDDLDVRHEWAKTQFIGAEITHVRTAWECVAALRDKGPFDTVSLDHDLGFSEHSYTEGEKNGNGQDVTRWVLEQAMETGAGSWEYWWLEADWIIHSWNPDGARNMARDLETAWCNVVVEPAKV
jgi:hypothetical protein